MLPSSIEGSHLPGSIRFLIEPRKQCSISNLKSITICSEQHVNNDAASDTQRNLRANPSEARRDWNQRKTARIGRLEHSDRSLGNADTTTTCCGRKWTPESSPGGRWGGEGKSHRTAIKIQVEASRMEVKRFLEWNQ